MMNCEGRASADLTMVSFSEVLDVRVIVPADGAA